MKTQHTPGPWQWDKERDQIVSVHPDWNHSLIAKVATGEDRKQEDANAALIASAPTLLAEVTALKARCAELTDALFELVSLHNEQTFINGELDNDSVEETLRKARAALAGKGDK